MMIRFLMWLYGVTEAQAAACAPVAWFTVLMIAVGVAGCIIKSWSEQETYNFGYYFYDFEFGIV